MKKLPKKEHDRLVSEVNQIIASGVRSIIKDLDYAAKVIHILSNIVPPEKMEDAIELCKEFDNISEVRVLEHWVYDVLDLIGCEEDFKDSVQNDTCAYIFMNPRVSGARAIRHARRELARCRIRREEARYDDSYDY